MTNNHDDWNPNFQRSRKRNRVSRGKPQRPRRYFVLPIGLLFVTVLLWRTEAVMKLVRYLRPPTPAVATSPETSGTVTISMKTWDTLDEAIRQRNVVIYDLREQLRLAQAQQPIKTKGMRIYTVIALPSTCIAGTIYRKGDETYVCAGRHTWRQVSTLGTVKTDSVTVTGNVVYNQGWPTPLYQQGHP